MSFETFLDIMVLTLLALFVPIIPSFFFHLFTSYRFATRKYILGDISYYYSIFCLIFAAVFVISIPIAYFIL